MTATRTEALHPEARGMDARPRIEAAGLLVEGQIAAALSLRHTLASLVSGAQAMATSVRSGGTLYYIAAGSSGLMAAADAQELGGTFSIPPQQLRILMAGGLPTGVEMPGGTEDETDTLAADMQRVTPSDTIIAVSASGTTPFTLAAADIARTRGATIIGIANNAGAPLLQAADHPICLATPPEVLSGSTRLGAGTAKKIALNTLSTLMAIELGHVHDGMMVNVRADNIKLRARAAGIVAQVTGADEATVQSALDTTGGDVKSAVLVIQSVVSANDARSILRETEGNLRAAMARST